MVEMNITLHLTEHQAERLAALTEAYDEASGSRLSQGYIFEMIMSVGSAQTINEKLDMLEMMTISLNSRNGR